MLPPADYVQALALHIACFIFWCAGSYTKRACFDFQVRVPALASGCKTLAILNALCECRKYKNTTLTLPLRRHDAQARRPRAPPRLVARPHPDVVGLARRQSFDHSLERGLRTFLGGYLPRFLFIPDVPRSDLVRASTLGRRREPLLGLVLLVLRHNGLAPATARPEDLADVYSTRFADAQLQLPSAFVHDPHRGRRTEPARRLYDQRLRPPRPAR